MKAILIFRLPEQQDEHDAALLGPEALRTLCAIDSRCSRMLRDDYAASDELRDFAEEIRGMIDGELLEH